MMQVPDVLRSAELTRALAAYERAVHDLREHPEALLAALLARDQVEKGCVGAGAWASEQVRQIANLDKAMEQRAAAATLSELARWREVVHPPESSGWWFLDRQAQKRKEENNVLWSVVTGLCLLATTTFAVEIIRRLWAGAPDLYAIFGTLLAALLTAVPLSKQGGELAQWALRRLKFIQVTQRAPAMATAAGLALLLVLVFWAVGLRYLALVYNNRGVAALRSDDLAEAQHAFQHAAAMNPDQFAAYHNLAVAYHNMGRTQEALDWYQKATARDVSFAPSYEGMSRLYAEQGKPDLAEQTALAGLQVVSRMRARPALSVSSTQSQPASGEAAQREITRYRLLGDLGRAYYAREKYGLAQQALEAAVGMEAALEALERQLHGQVRETLPHYYLAKIYTRQDNPHAARIQWEDALRYLKEDNWSDREWFTAIQEGLAQGSAGGPK